MVAVAALFEFDPDVEPTGWHRRVGFGDPTVYRVGGDPTLEYASGTYPPPAGPVDPVGSSPGCLPVVRAFVRVDPYVPPEGV